MDSVRHKEGYTALFEIKPNALERQAEVDRVFKSLLERINAENIKEIEPYD